MPVEGLGFADSEDGPFVTLGAEPFDQASQAQKIRVSVAIAAAMNPKLRVARILDGSLLDARSWAALEDYAATHDRAGVGRDDQPARRRGGARGPGEGGHRSLRWAALRHGSQALTMWTTSASCADKGWQEDPPESFCTKAHRKPPPDREDGQGWLQ
jgi:hypothetical protein